MYILFDDPLTNVLVVSGIALVCIAVGIYIRAKGGNKKDQ